MKNKNVTSRVDNLIQENPSLEWSKKELSSLFSTLDSLKQSTYPSSTFKQQLKSRISWVASMKQGSTKKWYIGFLVPVCSMLFIFWWIYYLLDSTKNLDNSLPWNIYTPDTFIEEDTPVSIDSSSVDVMEASDNPIEAASKLKVTDKKEVSAPLHIDTKEDVMPGEVEVSEKQESFREIQALEVKGISASEPSTKQEVQEINSTDEDTQLIDLFWDAVPESSSSLIEWWAFHDSPERESFGLQELLGDEADNTEFIQTKKLSFQDFCLEYGWEFIEQDEWNICKKENMQCKEEDYINGSCDFEEIK